MIEAPPPYQSLETEKNFSTRNADEPFILFKNKQFLSRRSSIFIVVNTVMLTLNWLMMAILRYKLGDYDGHLSAFGGESMMYMVVNIILWCFNIVYIFLNVTDITKKLNGGDINIQKIMIITCCTCSLLIAIACIWGIMSMSEPFFEFRSKSQIDEYRSLWACMVLGLITTLFSCIQVKIHYGINENGSDELPHWLNELIDRFLRI